LTSIGSLLPLGDFFAVTQLALHPPLDLLDALYRVASETTDNNKTSDHINQNEKSSKECKEETRIEYFDETIFDFDINKAESAPLPSAMQGHDHSSYLEWLSILRNFISDEVSEDLRGGRGYVYMCICIDIFMCIYMYIYIYVYMNM
jgi:hypothetical protein